MTRTMSALRSSYSFTTIGIAIILLVLVALGFAAYAWKRYDSTGCRIRVRSGTMTSSTGDGVCGAGGKLTFEYQITSRGSDNIGITIATVRLIDDRFTESDNPRDDGITYFVKLKNGEPSRFAIPCEFLIADQMKRTGPRITELSQRLVLFADTCSVGDENRGQCNELCDRWALEDLRKGREDRLRRQMDFGRLLLGEVAGIGFDAPQTGRAIDTFTVRHDIASYKNLKTIARFGQFRRDDLDRDLQAQRELIEKAIQGEAAKPEPPVFEPENQGGLGFFKKSEKTKPRSRRW